MKKLSFFIATMAISLFSFSQEIIMNAKEGQPFAKWKKTTAEDVLKSPEWSGKKIGLNGKYVINLDEMTSTLYLDGELYDVAPLKGFTIDGSLIKIDFDGEIPFFEDVKFQSSFIIDTEKKNMVVTWYNPQGKYTRAELYTGDLKINTTPSKPKKAT